MGKILGERLPLTYQGVFKPFFDINFYFLLIILTYTSIIKLSAHPPKTWLFMSGAGDFVRWSLALGRSIASLNGKFWFKPPFYIYILTWVYYRYFN